MAIVLATVTTPMTLPRKHHAAWAVAGATDTYGAIEVGPDCSVQMSGTWNSATIKIEGSNDGTTYIPLTDPQGNAISMTADAIEQISEIVRFIKPVITAGTPTAVTVTVTSSRAY